MAVSSVCCINHKKYSYFSSYMLVFVKEVIQHQAKLV